MRDSDDERPTDAHRVVDASSIEDELDGDGVTVTTVSDEHLRNGTDVGGYVIDGELGAGGMGVVYSATHPIIGKRAAIKVLKPELSGNPAAVERFVMEARAVNQIGHPNIVDIFAFGTLPDGRSYYVMDLLTGESLRRRLKRGGPLHPAEAIGVIDETASALMAAHDKGIVHRDLKPDNVFMVSVPGRWPEVRILDWGLLKLTSQQSAISSSKYRTLAGSVMGTPVYMSPEQARASESVDFRTDIYSLGVMSYELLAGVVPFKKGSSIDTLLAHQDDPVPPLADKCPALPIELVQLIEAMLAKEVDGRPTLAAVRAVIKRLRGTKIPTMTAAGLQMPELPTPRPSFVDPATGARPPLDSPSPFVEPPTSPALPRGASFAEPPTVNARLSGATTVPRLPSSDAPPEMGRAPTSQPVMGRAPTSQPAMVRASTSQPPSFGRAPTTPPMTAPRTQTPPGGIPRPGLQRSATSPPGSDSRSAATTPPPMRAQSTERTITTPPGGLPLPAPPRSERMQSQPDPELASQSMNSLPYQSINVSPSTLGSQSMPSMPGHSIPAPSIPMLGFGMPTNQGMAVANPGMSSSSNPGVPMSGPYVAPYPSQPSYPQVTPQATGTPQAMAATSSGGGMKRILVIGLAAIVVSAIGIAIFMLV